MALHSLGLFLYLGGTPSLPLSWELDLSMSFAPHVYTQPKLQYVSFGYFAIHGSLNCSTKMKIGKSWHLELYILIEHHAYSRAYPAENHGEKFS